MHCTHIRNKQRRIERDINTHVSAHFNKRKTFEDKTNDTKGRLTHELIKHAQNTIHYST